MKVASGRLHISGTHRIFGRTLGRLDALLASNILVVGFCRPGTCPPNDFRISPRGLLGGRNRPQKASRTFTGRERQTFCIDGYQGSRIVKPSILIFWPRLNSPGGCLRPDTFGWGQSSSALGSAVGPTLARQCLGGRDIQCLFGRAD